MSTPYFGRAWKVTITPEATGEDWIVADSNWGSESMRCSFEIEQTATLQAYWFADIAIYNFLPSAQQVIQKGDRIRIEAGYESPGMGPIFTGRIFQPIWERSNETDYRLTLHCFLGLFEDETGYVSVPIGSMKQSEAVRLVAQAAGIQCDPQNLDPILDQKTPPRGKPFAGRARAFFDQVAIDNNLVPWIGADGVHIQAMAPEGDIPDVIYAPPLAHTSQAGGVSDADSGMTKYTLIGTPRQTEQGVAFRTLLDPGLQLRALVKLDQAILNKLRLYPLQYAAKLSKDGLFVVAGIRYSGDSRGNEWYSEVVAVTRPWDKLFGVIAR